MRFFMMLTLLVSVVGFVGCSEKTATETGEAVKETGEAIESAATDAAENIEAGADAVGDALKSDDDGEEQ